MLRSRVCDTWSGQRRGSGTWLGRVNSEVRSPGSELTRYTYRDPAVHVGGRGLISRDVLEPSWLRLDYMCVEPYRRPHIQEET